MSNSKLLSVVDSLRDAADRLEEIAEYEEIQPSKAKESIVQGRMRGGKLHLQYGVLGSYRKADVEVSYNEGTKIASAYASEPSLAGSASRYVKGSINTDGSIMIAGVSVKSPFWSTEASPRKSSW